MITTIKDFVYFENKIPIRIIMHSDFPTRQCYIICLCKTHKELNLDFETTELELNRLGLESFVKSELDKYCLGIYYENNNTRY